MLLPSKTTGHAEQDTIARLSRFFIEKLSLFKKMGQTLTKALF
jgi:hypothetical protein